MSQENVLRFAARVRKNLAEHQDGAHPHPCYQRASEKGLANGYAGLGSDGKVPAAQLPVGGGGAEWGGIAGTLVDQTDLSTALDGKAATGHNHAGVYEPAGTVAAHEAAANPHDVYALEAALGTLATLTPTQATAVLDLFTSTLRGLVPPSGGGTTNFLRADGQWTAPSGGGGLTLTTTEASLGAVAKTSGRFDITGLSGLTTDRPVLIQQAVGPYTGKGTLADEVEMDLVTATAVVLNPTTIRVYWNSRRKVKGNIQFCYAIG